MNEQLIKFIEICLMDGVVSDKEREVIFRKSKEFGIPEDECEIILEGMIQQKGMVSENLSEDSSTKNSSEKPQKSNSYKPKKVPKSTLINLKNSEKLEEEIKILLTANDNLTKKNELLNKEISDSISLIEDNSLIYLNSLKVNDKFFNDFVVRDIIEDIDEVDMYKTEEGTVTWGDEGVSKKIKPVLPHPFFVIYNYVEKCVLEEYFTSDGWSTKKEGIKHYKPFSDSVFIFNIGEKRKSIIPEKYKRVNPLKILLLEMKKIKLVIYIYENDFIVIELKYSISFKRSNLILTSTFGIKEIKLNDILGNYWYSVTKVEHTIHNNLLKMLNI